MSRVGKKPIALPEKVDVSVANGILTVKGPQGTITREVPAVINVAIEAGKELTITPKDESPESSVFWGTFASHVKNMLAGVVTGYKKSLLIEGTGYKWDVKGDTLHMSLGFAHPVALKIPSTVKVTIEKGVLTVAGIDKETVGQFAASIRAQRKPEPYKGKGIRYETEVIRRKQGKKTT